MNFLPRCFILLAFSVLALVGCSRPPTQEEISARELSEADKVLLEKTNAVLDETIIPRVEFRDVTLKQAVSFLQQRAIEIARELPDRAIDTRDAEWKKVWAESSDRSFALAKLKFSVKYDGFEVPPQYVPLGESPVIPSLELQPSESQTVTLDLSNISLREVLQYCASLCNLEMRVQPGVVVFEPIKSRVEASPITFISGERLEFNGCKQATPTREEISSNMSLRPPTRVVEFICSCGKCQRPILIKGRSSSLKSGDPKHTAKTAIVSYINNNNPVNLQDVVKDLSFLLGIDVSIDKKKFDELTETLKKEIARTYNNKDRAEQVWPWEIRANYGMNLGKEPYLENTGLAVLEDLARKFGMTIQWTESGAILVPDTSNPKSLEVIVD
jgi:hypothetical protein